MLHMNVVSHADLARYDVACRGMSALVNLEIYTLNGFMQGLPHIHTKYILVGHIPVNPAI